MINNATPIEVIWFVIGLITFVFAMWNIIDSFSDWIWVRSNHVRLEIKRVARIGLLRASGWLACAFLCVWVGGVAIVLPPSQTSGTVSTNIVISLLYLSTVGSLILLEIIITGMIMIEVLDRRNWRREQSS